MNASIEELDSQKLVNFVSLYTTPLALLLGGMGIAVSDYDNNLRDICLGTLGFSAIFNLMYSRFLKRISAGKKAGALHVRMAVNLLVNALLLYALGETFRPMWLILALSPIATAVYGTRQKATEAAATASVVLVTVYVLRRSGGYQGWIEQLGCVAFIFLISLMINGVGKLLNHPEKAV